MKKLSIYLSILGICAGYSLAHADGKVQNGKKADSLKALQLLISLEIKPENRVLYCGIDSLTDSLINCGEKANRLDFDRLIGDSAVAREIKTKDEFHRYWLKLEHEKGFEALKKQYERQDIDKTLIPKKYFFDSSVVIYPGWIILRKK